MTYRLIIRDAAEADLQHAFDWYEDQRSGLGLEFFAAIDDVIASIVSGPLKYQEIHQELRRALVRRFPYGVFFAVREDVVSIIAVTHHAQHPEAWQRRAE